MSALQQEAPAARAETEAKLKEAFAAIDALNACDPNFEMVEGKARPKALIYGQRMSACLESFCPEASFPLQLAARCSTLNAGKAHARPIPRAESATSAGGAT